MKTQEQKKKIIIVAMIAGIVLGLILFVVGLVVKNSHSLGEPRWYKSDSRGMWIILLGIYLASYSACFGTTMLLVEKYHAPKGLIWLALANIYGMIPLLILMYKPNGYAARSNMVSCPHCGGRIGKEFIICPICRYEIGKAPASAANSAQPVRNGLYCTQCGTKNDAGALFCESCGKKL